MCFDGKEEKMSTKVVSVWIDGVRYEGVKAAAEDVSLFSGQKISAIRLSRLIKSKGIAVVNGVTVSAFPPVKKAVETPYENETLSPVTTRRLLLCYPKGEAPIDRGVCRARP
jgi:hypothetical protein